MSESSLLSSTTSSLDSFCTIFEIQQILNIFLERGTNAAFEIVQRSSLPGLIFSLFSSFYKLTVNLYIKKSLPMAGYDLQTSGIAN